MPNINMVINNWTIHRGTSWERGHPQNGILHSQVSPVLIIPPPPPPLADLFPLINFITYLQYISRLDRLKMHTIHRKHAPVNQIQTKCFKELHQEQGQPQNGMLHSQTSTVLKMSLLLDYVFNLYKSYNLSAIHVQLLIVWTMRSIYAKHSCGNRMTNTRYIEVHPENGGKRDNSFLNILCAENAPSAIICIPLLSIIFHIWNTFIASGCLK